MDFEGDENEKIDSEFRFLSIRGVFEDISDWRRNEDDSGIFLNQQVRLELKFFFSKLCSRKFRKFS